jgi:signal transduction histidine kinase
MKRHRLGVRWNAGDYRLKYMLTDLAATHALFLADVSKQLGSSLDYKTTLDCVARAALPDFADWCIVDVVDDAASIKRVAVAHADPGQEVSVREFAHRYTPEATALDGVAKAMRTARPKLVSAMDDALLRELGAHSGIIAPLIVQDRILGALSLASARGYCESDLALAEELASRCAQAIEHAVQYRLACEAIEVRDTFVATISHDLKNPLATIGAQAQLMQRLAASPQSTDTTEKLMGGTRRITSTVERMSRMIDGLLDVTRLELGARLELERAPMDLVEGANRIAAEHQERAPGHRIQVAGETALIGEWDLARIERVLDNLVGNAVKYSPHGGVITVVCVREVDETGEWALLSVRDHGVGIPTADLGRIFERFHRAGNVRAISGAGIGLAMIRDVVSLHGGTITVESSEGQGSTFTIRLPTRA